MFGFEERFAPVALAMALCSKPLPKAGPAFEFRPLAIDPQKPKIRETSPPSFFEGDDFSTQSSCEEEPEEDDRFLPDPTPVQASAHAPVDVFRPVSFSPDLVAFELNPEKLRVREERDGGVVGGERPLPPKRRVGPKKTKGKILGACDAKPGCSRAAYGCMPGTCVLACDLHRWPGKRRTPKTEDGSRATCSVPGCRNLAAAGCGDLCRKHGDAKRSGKHIYSTRPFSPSLFPMDDRGDVGFLPITATDPFVRCSTS